MYKGIYFSRVYKNEVSSTEVNLCTILYRKSNGFKIRLNNYSKLACMFLSFSLKLAHALAPQASCVQIFAYLPRAKFYRTHLI